MRRTVRIDARKLAWHMVDKNKTISQLADDICTSRPTLSSIKNGRSCSRLMAERIARGLGVTVEDLLL